ncbi:hypothetical protein [Mesoplasma tabanidae]|uniref:hypothetical protein n=1 Tax=Mesoplasma tabanidae TaxID=219745 RepID=UPI001FC9FC16|nr:hypothetical protein [Mesoplasma tabanidae]
MSNEDIMFSINNKMLGQVNTVLIGINFINETGSITLITGKAKDEPIKEGTMLALTNGAVMAFAKAAAYDLKKNIRINSISPSIFDESLNLYGDYFKGIKAIPVAKAADAFINVIESDINGQEIKVY